MLSLARNARQHWCTVMAQRRSLSTASPQQRQEAAPRVRDYHGDDFPHDALSGEGVAFVARCNSLTLPAPERAAQLATTAGTAWEAFYQRHRGAFFKPRHFTLEAFPALRDATSMKLVLETGAGNGSNVFSLLEGNPAVHLHAVDIAASSLEAIQCNPQFAAVSHRVTLQSWSVLDAPPSPALPPFDAALTFFVLSCIHPSDHARALRNIRGTLRPGGLLCFRDYGHLDLAQLRAADRQILTPSLHQRVDGTLAYYFQEAELRALLEEAGFVVVELKYCTVERVNRAKGVAMRRVWIHALCRNPEPDCTVTGASALAGSCDSGPGPGGGDAPC